MRTMLLFLHAWKIFLVVIPSMTCGNMSPIKWWAVHGTSTPMLQSIALKFLGQRLVHPHVVKEIGAHIISFTS